MKELVKNALNKLKEIWKAHGREIVLFGGVFLVGIIGFELGLVEGQSMLSKPLVIEAPEKPVILQASQNTITSDTSNGVVKVVQENSSVQNQNSTTENQVCKFVGSKNSNKYHLPTCSFAKRIKPENARCFSSEEDAKSKGYVAGCLK